MAANTKKLNKLSPEELDEVADFAEFIHSRSSKTNSQNPTFNWAGTAEELSNESDSVELQHKISRWWAESVSD